VELYEVLSW